MFNPFLLSTDCRTDAVTLRGQLCVPPSTLARGKSLGRSQGPAPMTFRSSSRRRNTHCLLDDGRCAIECLSAFGARVSPHLCLMTGPCPRSSIRQRSVKALIGRIGRCGWPVRKWCETLVAFPHLMGTLCGVGRTIASRTFSPRGSNRLEISVLGGDRRDVRSGLRPCVRKSPDSTPPKRQTP